MTRNLTLRTRLTLTILVLTGAVAALSVTAGMRMLRADARQAAVDEQLANAIETAPVGSVTIAAGPDTIVIDDLATVLEDQLALDQGTFDRFEADYAASVISELGLYPDLLEAFADTDGRLHLMLTSGTLVTLGGSGRIEFGSDPTTDAPVVLASSIADLEGNFFDPVTPDVEGRHFEFATTVVSGTSLGVVAEATDRLQALDDVARALWFSAGALTLLAALASWLLIGQALKPVAAITHRVGEITSGNLGDRVPVPGRQDEIGMLASTMNTMLGRLETSDLRRRRFISDASHELRTPVAVLQSEAEVARRAPEATTVAELSEVVMAESLRLGNLVEGLLAIARSDEPADAHPQLQEVDVDEIVLAESQRSRRVPVDRSSVSAGRILAQHDDVARVVGHLLDNAARHAVDKVAVGLATEGETVMLHVDDDGPGIPPADRARVFERFVRLDDARTRDRGGAGLGLAVVRSSVERFGGTVLVEDAPLGGARFVVRWPAA